MTATQDRRGRREAGFTLIEIMVVVIVLAIMAGLIVPKLSFVTDDAKIATAESKIKTISSVLELYMQKNDNLYPESLDALVNPPEDSKLTEGMLKSKDLLDPWENRFLYEVSEDRRSFQLWSYGADGQPEGEGANKDIYLDDPEDSEG